MHGFDDNTERLAQEIVELALERIRMSPPPLDGPRKASVLQQVVGETVTPKGIGAEKALQLFFNVLARSCTTLSHPRNFAAVPSAPTNEAVLFDLMVSAASIFGGAWAGGAGAIFAENQVLKWLADEAGFPETAGGTFVQGGTLGILSALVAGRAKAQAARPGEAPRVWKIAVSAEAHFATAESARVMGCELLVLPVDENHRVTGGLLREALTGADTDGLFAVVASAGTTNLGVIDDLDGIAQVCEERGLWFHVDGAYGFPGILAPSTRQLFKGIARADSFVVDPHKWLFSPYDACALVYRDIEDGSRAHSYSDVYITALHPDPVDPREEFDPKNYAVQLSRRVRGLPLWFSLAANGTEAYATAVEKTLAVVRAAAEEIRRRDYLDLLMEPTLTVIIFRRIGWQMDDYLALNKRLLTSGIAWFMPTLLDGEPVARLISVNPGTTLGDYNTVLDAMR